LVLRRIVSPVNLFVRAGTVCTLLAAAAVCHAQQDALTSCLAGLETDPRFTAIAGKLATGARPDATPQMLDDLTTATGKQVRALADWTAARSECVRAEAASGNASYRPPLQAFRLEAEGEVIEAAADLHDGRITYGEFNRRRQAIDAALQGKIAGLSRRIEAQRAAREQADRLAREKQQMQRSLEEAERQAAAAQQQAALARQEAEQARRAARQPAAPADPPHRMQRPRVAPPVPYASCFRLGERTVCTYR
jgi:hypothetical protein